ncbi:hypothetical protein ACFL22_00880 [Patescibacteria group bacterium]
MSAGFIEISNLKHLKFHRVLFFLIMRIYATYTSGDFWGMEIEMKKLFFVVIFLTTLFSLPVSAGDRESFQSCVGTYMVLAQKTGHIDHGHGNSILQNGKEECMKEYFPSPPPLPGLTEVGENILIAVSAVLLIVCVVCLRSRYKAKKGLAKSAVKFDRSLKAAQENLLSLGGVNETLKDANRVLSERNKELASMVKRNRQPWRKRRV